MRRAAILKRAGYVALGVCFLFGLILTVLHTSPVQRYALGQVSVLLAAQGVRFSASNLRYNLLGLRVHLENIVVRSTAATDLPPLVQVASLDASLNLIDLLRGRYIIESGTISQPIIHFVVDEQGRDNLPKPPKKESQEKIDYLIDTAVITAGSVRYEDRRQKIDVTLPAWQIEVDGNPLTRNHEITLKTARAGQILFQGRTVPLDAIAAAVLLKDDAAEVRSLQLTSGETTVALGGTVNQFSDPVFDVKLNTNVQLKWLTELAGTPQQVTGSANVTLAAKGPLPKLQATATIKASDVVVEKLPPMQVDSELAYDAGSQRLGITRATIVSPTGNLQASGSIAINTSAGQSRVRSTVSNLDLVQISRTAKLPVQIASRLNGTADISFPGLLYEQAAGSANVSLTATRAAAPNIIPLTGNLSARGNGNNLTATIMSLETTGLAAQGEVTLTNRSNVAGQVMAVVDLAAAQQHLASPTAGVAGKLNAAITLSGTVKQPQAEVALNGSGLQAGDQKDIAVTASATANQERISIHNAEIRLLQQEVFVKGDVMIAGNDPVLALNARIENASIQSILGALGKSDTPAQGTVSATADVSGTAKKPVVVASANATGLQAYGEPLGTLNTQARFENQIVNVSSLTLNKPDSQPLTASGTYSLDTKTFTLEAAARAFHVTALTLPDGTTIRGDLDLNATSSGSIENPTLTASLDARNLRVKDIEAGEVHLKATVADQKATFETSAPGYNLTAGGTVGIKEPYAAQITVKADKTDLAKLPVKLDPPVAGVVTATAEAAGNLNDWAKGTLSATVDALNLQFKGQTIRTEGPLVARYGKGTLELGRAVILAADSKLSIEGSLPLEASAPAGAIKIEGALDLASLAAMAPSEETPVTARGTMNIAGTIKGTLKKIEPDIAFTLREGSVETPNVSPLSAINIEGAIRDGALQLSQLTASWASAQISSQGTVPLGIFPTNLPVEIPRQSGPAKFTLDVKGLDLANVKGVPSRVRGKASLHLDAEAPKPDLQSLTGKLTFPEFSLTLDRVPINQQGISTLTIQNGVARIEQFDLRGPETNLALSGTAGLTGAYPLDLKATGNFDMGVLASFVENVRMQGPVKLEVSAGGTVKAPNLGGFIELTDGRAVVPNPSLAAENVQMRVDLQNDRLNVTKVTGSLNGGNLTGGGGLRFVNGDIDDATLKLRAENVYLAFPLGFKTLSTTEINLTSIAKQLRLGGAVLVHEGSYTDRLSLETGLLQYIRSGQSDIELTEDRNPTLARLGYDIGIHTLSPIVVDNNLAKAEATMHLRLRGNYYRPGLTGRITVEEGGELYLNEKKYLVDRGVINFTNELRIEPELDILARTQASSYDITLQLSGGGGEKLNTTLTSDPVLSEPDIIALLITGRTLSEMQGAEADIAKEQALSFLTGSIGGQIGSGLERATGLSHVRIEPNLIANESDPSARLTIGQDLTRDLRVVYSMKLTDSGDQIYVAEYDVTRRFLTRAVKQSDNSYRMEVRHDIQFGGTAPPRRSRDSRTGRTVGTVGFTGETFFPPKQLADRFKVKQGKRYDFFQVREGLDRIDKLYTSNGFLEARTRLKREEKPAIVDLSLDVHAGPKIEFVFEGWDVPGGTKKKIRDLWHDGVFEAQRTDEANAAIREALISDDYLDSQVSATVTSREASTKRVLFDIQPGIRFHNVDVVFDGASAVEPKRLQALLKEQKLENAVYSNPGRVTQTLTAYYRERGYLDVKVSDPRKELDATTRGGRVVIQIAEGPRYKVGRIQFAGNNAYNSEQLMMVMPFENGETYLPSLREQSVNRLIELYSTKGFTAIDIEPAIARHRDTGTVDLIYQITENAQRMVKSIAIEGNDNTSKNLISSQVTLKEGQPLNLKELAKSRRNLYDTGAYQLIDIDRDEPPVTDITASTQIPVNLHVKVREVRPFEIKYGGYYDTDRGPGGVIDITNRNSLGSARVIGLRTRYDSDLREGRLYFSQPLLRRFPLRTIASAFARREFHPDFRADRVGFSVQEEARPWEKYVINFGYRIEWLNETFPDPIFGDVEISNRVAPLTTSFTRDTRDDILDAARGSLTSHALEWAPSALGSDLRFIRYFGQYFKYFALSEPTRIPWSGIRKSRLVFATAARIGLGGGLGGQTLVPSERFYAGGGTTIRGFQQDFVGPLENESPTGGGGLFILNNEIRFPMVSIFDGVGFLDIGNVYSKVRDFDVTDLRKTVGAGLRVRTPYFLLRFDYGVKVGRRPGEGFGRFFFSIGQAF